MGLTASSISLLPEEVSILQQETHCKCCLGTFHVGMRHQCPPKVTRYEIQCMYQRFMEIDRKKKGIVTVDDVLMIPELAMNPISERIIDLFDRDGQYINFRTFLELLAVFSDKAKPELRNDVLFKLHDVDKDGYISVQDLVEILKICCGKNFSDGTIERMAKKAIKGWSHAGSDRLSPEDFAKVRVLACKPALSLGTS